MQNELANWFGGSVDQLQIPIRYNLLYNAAMLVKGGFGDALTIRLDCAYPGLRFVPLEPPIRLGSVLVWKKQQDDLPRQSGHGSSLAKQCLKDISNDAR